MVLYGGDGMSRSVVRVQVIGYQIVPDPVFGDYREQCHPEEADTYTVYLVTADGDRHLVSDHNLLVNAQSMGYELAHSMFVGLEVVGQ